jgi:hypothetical protein
MTKSTAVSVKKDKDKGKITTRDGVGMLKIDHRGLTPQSFRTGLDDRTEMTEIGS